MPVWTFASDWKPEPNGSGLEGWEPVFHPVDANGFIYVPGAGGTVWKVNQADGTSAAPINPFSGMNVTAADTYVAGPLTADSAGNIYYNVIELADPSVGDPWQNDVQGAWLVKVTPAGATSVLSFRVAHPRCSRRQQLPHVRDNFPAREHYLGRHPQPRFQRRSHADRSGRA